MRSLRKRLWGCGVGVAALLFAAAAYAAIPSSGGSISGCYERHTGVLRVIDAEAGAKCLSFETPINWNVQGTKGDPGAPGPQGPQGPPGPGGVVADGSITTAKFDPAATAPNSDKLDGKDSSDFLPATVFPRLVTTDDIYQDLRSVTVPAGTTQTIDLQCSHTGFDVHLIDMAISGGIQDLDTTSHVVTSMSLGGSTWRWVVTTGDTADSLAVQVTCVYHA